MPSGRSGQTGHLLGNPASTRRVERVPRRAQRLHTLPHRRSGTATSSPAIGAPGPAAAAAAPDCLYTIQEQGVQRRTSIKAPSMDDTKMDEAKDDGVEEIDAKAFEDEETTSGAGRQCFSKKTRRRWCGRRRQGPHPK